MADEPVVPTPNPKPSEHTLRIQVDGPGNGAPPAKGGDPGKDHENTISDLRAENAARRIEARKAREDLEAAQAACVGVVPRDAAGEFRARRQLGEGLVAGVLDQAHAEGPERGLRRIAHEAAGIQAPGSLESIDRLDRAAIPYLTEAWYC